MRRVKDANLVLVGTVLYCTGGVVFYVIPAILANVSRVYDVPSANLGLLPALELAAIAFASLTGPFWIGRFSWRLLIRVGAVASLLGQVVSLAAPSYIALLGIRAATGALGEGLLLALSYSLLGRSQNMERAFGIAYAASVVISMICLYAAPALDQMLRTDSVLVVVALLSAAALLASFFVPADRKDPSAQVQQQAGVPAPRRGLGALALLTQVAWFAGAGGFWSFTEQLAAQNALAAAEIAQAMALGTGAALLGAIIASALDGRFGRTWPTVVSALVMAVSVYVFISASRFVGAAIELALFNVCWATGTIYLTAAACAVDNDGKVAVLVPAAQTLGMSIGSAILGRAIQDFGASATPWITTAFLAATFVLIAGFNGLLARNLRVKVA